jgi:hypothetical protein
MAGKPSIDVLDVFLADSHSLTTQELALKYKRSQTTIKDWRAYCRQEGLDVGHIIARPVTKGEVEFDVPEIEHSVDIIEEALLANARAQKALYAVKEEDVLFKFGNMPVMITFWGDWHVGQAGLELFLADLELVSEQDGVYTIGMGDYKGNMARAPFRTTDGELIRPGWQDRLLAERYMPATKEFMLGLLVGCHDHWDLSHDVEFMEVLCKAACAKHLWHQSTVELIFDNAGYRGVVRHKARRESSLNTTNPQRAIYENYGYPDFIAIAHKHFADLKVQPRTDKGETVWVRSGSYLDLDEYAQRLVGQGGEAVFPGIIFLPDQEQMIPYRDFKLGLARLQTLRLIYKEGGTIQDELGYLNWMLDLSNIKEA